MNKTNGSWIADLKEYRIALGVAAVASLAVVVILVMQPASPTQETPKQSISGHAARSDSPLYPLPHRQAAPPPPAQKARIIPPQAKIRAITPATPATPIHRTAPVKKPLTTKPPHVKAQVANKKPVKQSASRPRTSTTVEKAAAVKGNIFFVQVGAYRELHSAQQQAANLMQKGWNSMVTRNAGGLHVVRVGPVSSLTAAGKLRKQLATKANIKGFVVRGG